MRISLLALLGAIGTSVAAAQAAANQQTRTEERSDQLDRIETRLRSIYEQGRYGPRAFRVDWLPNGKEYASRGRNRRVFDAESGAARELTAAEQSALERDTDLSPNGAYRLVRARGDLAVRAASGGPTRKLTNTGSRDAVRCGRAAWSPDSTRIAFVETDASAVRIRTMPVPDEPTYPTPRRMRFARVGGTIERLRVGVARVAAVEAEAATATAATDEREIQWIDLDQPEEGFYLGQVEWAGNSDELLIERLSRFRDEREFLLADVRTGATTRIFYEKDPAWVAASYQTNLGLEWIEDGSAFVVIHERDGWRHAWIHERNGKPRHLLTDGAYDIIERGPVDEAGGWFYFYASPDNATQRHLHRVPLDGSGKAERLTPSDQRGTHDYDIAPGCRYAIHRRSTFDEPPTFELVSLPEHRVLRTLQDNAALRERIRADRFRETEFLQVDIGEDITLDAWLMKPPDFDPSKKYPVLVYVYSEPHAQTVLDSYGAAQAAYHRVVSDLGYLILSIDSRGTPAPKGAAWRRAVFGSLGPLSTKEQAAALRKLGAQRSEFDMSRIGIWGWSGGGSNTLNAMFREPDLYHVGIAVAAKPQPWLYNAWFQEIYMRTREVNPDGYERSAPIHFAEGLRGDLLIVHGTGELNTHIQITEGLVDRLIALGKRFDYMAYPNRRHGIREGDGTTVHLRSLLIRYLLDHLPPGGR